MTAAHRTPDRIRASLNHPVIDSDGHIVEFQPAVMSYLEEIAGADAVSRYQAWNMRLAPADQERLDERLMRLPFWNFQTRNTLDRATVAFPALLRERMEEKEAQRNSELKDAMETMFAQKEEEQNDG